MVTSITLLLVLISVTNGLSPLEEPCTTIAGCLVCPDPNICTKCDGSQNFQPTPTPKGTCECVTGYFVSRGKCIACETAHTYCLSCTSDGNLCTQCRDGYYLDKGSCSACGDHCLKCASSKACDICADGYIWNGTVCLSCGITNCKTCSKAKQCTKCLSGHYLKHHVNPLVENNTCYKCIDNCD